MNRYEDCRNDSKERHTDGGGSNGNFRNTYDNESNSYHENDHENDIKQENVNTGAVSMEQEEINRLVSEDTVNKGTSKCHKMDEKPSILRCTFLHQYLYILNYPTTPITLSKM